MPKTLKINAAILIIASFFLFSACSKKQDTGTKKEEKKSQSSGIKKKKESNAKMQTSRKSVRRENVLSKRKSKIQKGEALRDFTAKTVTGDDIKLSEFQKDKYILIDFWATWCRPCLREIPHLQTALKKYGDKENFAILGVSLDKDPERVKKFVDKYKLNYPHVFDGKMWQNEVAMLYGVNAIPFTVLLGPDGKVIATNLRGPKLTEYLSKHIKS